jgi:predicted methyltransferase
MKRRTLIGAMALATCRTARAEDALKAAVAGEQRTPSYAKRDPWRHPYETLSFFGLRPDMTVVEINPGSGWYTEILAPVLRDRGLLILAAPGLRSQSPYARRSAERLRSKLQAQLAVYDRVRMSWFEPPQHMELAAAGTADLTLTFRNVHNWVAQGDIVVRAVFGSVYRSLKPGGVFGVVDHRLPADQPQPARAEGGYLHSAYVVRLAESVGFSLAASSEINANPHDHADHDGGVWALPPSYVHKDKDRGRYAAIGESDRMTLKFVKA